MRNRVGSLFSGIGGMDKGLQDAGWEIAWQVEIDAWCRRVLAARFPGSVQYGDARERRGYSPVDLLSFGFPCTDLSVAGKREGLGGDESRLFWAAMVIARRLKPSWLLIENVPGLLSSHQGRDFGIVLGALAHLGYWWSYRVLDSQYFGVPQRRRRVYIVGRLGAPVPPEVLFEPAGLSGDPATRRRAREEVAGAVTASAGHHGHSSPRGDGSDTLVPSRSHPLLAKGNSSFDDSLETYVVNARQDPVNATDQSLPLDAGHPVHAVAGTVTGAEAHNGNSNPIPDNYVVGPTNRPGGRDWHRLDQARSLNQGGGPGASSGYIIQDARGTRQNRQNGIGIQQGGPSYTLDGVSRHAISEEIDPDRVRETPGPARRMDLPLCRCADSPRYEGLGNGVTATVAEWIGRRILEAHRVTLPMET